MIGCLIVNHFRARAELARRPQLADCAGVIVERSGRRSVVVDTLPAIRGAVAGMRLDLLMLYPFDEVRRKSYSH